MKLFLVHCGFYDRQIGTGIFEFHVDFFVAAKNFENAKTKAKGLAEFKKKKMHIDGVIEVKAASGYRVSLTRDEKLRDETVVHAYADSWTKLNSSS